MRDEEDLIEPTMILEQIYNLSQQLVKYVIDEYPDDYRFYTFAMDLSGTMVEYMEEFDSKFSEEEAPNDGE